MVSTEAPRDAELEASIVNVEVPDPCSVSGLKVALTPCGSPFRLKFTVPENAPKGITLMS